MKVAVTALSNTQVFVILSTASVALTIGSAVALGQPAGDRREAALTRAQILEDLPELRDAIARGEDVNIVEAEPPDPSATTTLHGAFRFIPDSYVGELPKQRISDPPSDLGEVTDDTAKASISPLYREPSFMLDDFQFVGARSPIWGTPANVAVEAVYRSRSGAEIIVRRERIIELPIDLVVNERSPVITVEPIELSSGEIAVAFGWRSEREQVARGIPSNSVISAASGFRMVMAFNQDEGVVTAVELSGPSEVSMSDLVLILESVI